MRKISLQVKAGAKENRVEDLGDGNYRVFVKAPPVGGKANDAVVAVLAAYLGVARGRVKIKAGQSSKRKILVID